MNATLHHVVDGKTLCGVTLKRHDEFTVADDPTQVTCQRCLKALAKTATPEAAPEQQDQQQDQTPQPPAGATPEAAQAALATLAAPKASKKPANVHLHHDQTGVTLKSGSAAPNSWCKIPGPTTEDPAEVTCKVCRAHLDGVKPSNALPDSVKAARRVFASFVARATYMAYMDRPANSPAILDVPWQVEYTNLAGIRYVVEGHTHACSELATEYVLCEFQPNEASCTPIPCIGADLKAKIEKLCWEA